MKGLRLLCGIAVTLVLGITNTNTVFSQDAHLSQFDAAPLYFNPALSGKAQCEHRFIANAKQDKGNYRTFLLSYDRKIANDDLEFIDLKGDLGIGAMIENDVAGDTRIGDTRLRIIPAYHKDLLGSALQLSVGADLNASQSSVDETAIILPDGSSGSDANIDGSKFFFSCDLGVNLSARIKQKYPVNLGVAMFDIVNTKKSFVSDASTEDQSRLSFNANTIIPVAPMIEILPSALYMNQKSRMDKVGGNNEFVGGSWARYDISNQVKQLDALLVGVFSQMTERNNQVSSSGLPFTVGSIIFGIAAEAPVSVGTLSAGISYDVSVGAYTEDSDRGENGSFELSIKYFFCKKEFDYTPPAKLNPVFN